MTWLDFLLLTLGVACSGFSTSAFDSLRSGSQMAEGMHHMRFMDFHGRKYKDMVGMHGHPSFA